MAFKKIYKGQFSNTQAYYPDNSDNSQDVFVSISGMHEEIAETPAVERDEAEAIEVVTPGSYYFRNEKHYIVYDEAVEGSSEMIRNRIKITGTGCVEIVKSGLSDSHMIFEKNKNNHAFFSHKKSAPCLNFLLLI